MPTAFKHNRHCQPISTYLTEWFNSFVQFFHLNVTTIDQNCCIFWAIVNYIETMLDQFGSIPSIEIVTRTISWTICTISKKCVQCASALYVYCMHKWKYLIIVSKIVRVTINCTHISTLYIKITHEITNNFDIYVTIFTYFRAAYLEICANCTK